MAGPSGQTPLTLESAVTVLAEQVSPHVDVTEPTERRVPWMFSAAPMSSVKSLMPLALLGNELKAFTIWVSAAGFPSMPSKLSALLDKAMAYIGRQMGLP